jgi:hypothetical protein
MAMFIASSMVRTFCPKEAGQNSMLPAIIIARQIPNFLTVFIIVYVNVLNSFFYAQ